MCFLVAAHVAATEDWSCECAEDAHSADQHLPGPTNAQTNSAIYLRCGCCARPEGRATRLKGGRRAAAEQSDDDTLSSSSSSSKKRKRNEALSSRTQQDSRYAYPFRNPHKHGREGSDQGHKQHLVWTSSIPWLRGATDFYSSPTYRHLTCNSCTCLFVMGCSMTKHISYG